jgi:hypothetical protein
VLIIPSLGVSNWAIIYKTPTSTPHHQQVFLEPLPRIEKEEAPTSTTRQQFF